MMPFGLVADVDDHLRGGHFENRALDDLAFRDVPEAAIVDVQQPGVFGGIDLVVVVSRPGLQAPALAASAFAVDRRCTTAPGRTGSVLFFYVRHALRVLLSSFDARSGRPERVESIAGFGERDRLPRVRSAADRSGLVEVPAGRDRPTRSSRGTRHGKAEFR